MQIRSAGVKAGDTTLSRSKTTEAREVLQRASFALRRKYREQEGGRWQPPAVVDLKAFVDFFDGGNKGANPVRI